jgi:DNA-binding MarR family transcriptional regulator
MARATRAAEGTAGAAAAVEFGPLASIAGFTMRLANLLLFRDYYDHFASSPGALSLGAISVMTVIAANPGIRQGAAAEALLIKRSNMTKLVNRLERQGLVRRRASGRDRRAVGLYLTPLGRRRLGALLPAVAAQDAESTMSLNARERRVLVELLGKLIKAMRSGALRRRRSGAQLVGTSAGRRPARPVAPSRHESATGDDPRVARRSQAR